MPALHSVLFNFTHHQETSGYSMSLIRDPARGTSQFYIRVAWTTAFKQFFPTSLLLAVRTSAVAAVSKKVKMITSTYNLRLSSSKNKVVPFLLSRINKLDRRLRAVSLLLVRVFEQRSHASCEGASCEDANTRALATRATLLLRYSRLQVFKQKRDYLHSNSTAILTPEKPRDIAFMLSVLSACKDSGHRE